MHPTGGQVVGKKFRALAGGPEDWIWVLAFPQTRCVTLKVGFDHLQVFVFFFQL